ncbi:hypothetical protein JTE90_009295 [Oedothorax gibbosus]|uniref:Uncharacterized protein n=1 Tax=Oedothorax gibbosus TaxID=931172 RepID=A0AAV6TFX5_9ARAC|nr:hypothetical protein JTE90_009295 [Oedothorax gibbosus]
MSASLNPRELLGEPLLVVLIIPYAAKPKRRSVCTQNPTGPPPEFPWPRAPVPGIVLPSFGSPKVSLKIPPLPQWNAAGARFRPPPRGKGDPNAADPRRPVLFHFAAGLIQDPLTRAKI